MSKSNVFLFAVVLAVAAFVGSQVLSTQRRALDRTLRLHAARSAARDDSAAAAAALQSLRSATRGSRGSVRMPRWIQEQQARRMTAEAGPPVRDPGADLALVREHAHRGYLGDIARDNAGRLARWPARTEPLRVWVQPAPRIASFRPEYVGMTRAALRTWTEAAGSGFGMVPTDDSTDADVYVLWIERLSGPRIGETLRITDQHDWIVASSIVLALHGPDAEPLDVYTIQNAARHELGHVLGLDHSMAEEDIMFPSAGRQDRLSARDVATLRLLYALPPGPLPVP